MPTYVTLAPHLTIGDLEGCYRRARDPVERTHWHLLWLVAQGHRVPVVARLVGYPANWVPTIIRRYNAEGPAGIVNRRQHNPGARPLLSAAVREELRQALVGPAPDGGLWTDPKVAAWMAARLHRPVGEPRGWEAMRALGFTPQRPRPRATSADVVAQDAFKKAGSATPSRR